MEEIRFNAAAGRLISPLEPVAAYLMIVGNIQYEVAAFRLAVLNEDSFCSTVFLYHLHF